MMFIRKKVLHHIGGVPFLWYDGRTITGIFTDDLKD